jgi:hypothetical protein
MRKVALVLAGVVIGGAVGVAGWQVAFAAPVDTITVCTRPGTDVRSPSTNGTCPSGYTKTEIGDGAQNPVYDSSGFQIDYLTKEVRVDAVPPLQLPVGDYTVVANGRFSAGEGTAILRCWVVLESGQEVAFGIGQHTEPDVGENITLANSFTQEVAGTARLVCEVVEATDVTDVESAFDLVITRVSSITHPSP